MKNLYVSLLTLFSFFIVSFALSVPAIASTESYKITDAFHSPPPTTFGNNFVHYYTYIGFNYHGGDVIISRNPDGTGDANVGDMIQVASLDNAFVYNNRVAPYDCINRGEMPPTDITTNFKFLHQYILQVRLLDTCGYAKDFSQSYIVIKNIPDPSPTPTVVPAAVPTLIPTAIPTVVPTSIPTQAITPTVNPVPLTVHQFLDLPWDYRAHGMNFNDAALSIGSFFDHSFPLLSISNSVKEPEAMKDQVTTFGNEKSSQLNYSSHDGYDYATRAKVHINDPVLAAAAGNAKYINTCAACGNMIEIDHGNGYQTRYMHLQKDGLLSNIPGKLVAVQAGQIIGKVGATGHVIPEGDKGAHIHFQVIEDKNHDGNFDDNIPDGLTDPFGWQSTEADPWSSYAFNYLGKDRTGNKSSYLWKTNLQSLNKVVKTSGDILKTDRFTLNIPPDAVKKDTVFSLTSAQVVNTSNKMSLGPKLIATAKDLTGTALSQFEKSLSFTMDFSNLDLIPFKLSSLAIYSSIDGITWERQATVIDMTHHTATSEINHFSQYALMGEKRDSNPPITTDFIRGTVGQKGWYRSDVNVKLSSFDQNGSGVDYILYTLDDKEWEEYKSMIKIETEGKHTLQFYAVDKDGNIEKTKSIEFSIDKTLPEVRFSFNPQSRKFDISSINSSDLIKTHKIPGTEQESISITDLAGNMLQAQIYRLTYDRFLHYLEIKSLSYNNSVPKYTFNSLSIILNQTKTPILGIFEQTLRKGIFASFKLEYNFVKDKTKVYYWDKKTPIFKEEVNGMKLLNLITNHGSIDYSY